MRDRLLSVEGLGIGSVKLVVLAGWTRFSPLSVSSSWHEGERSRGVDALGHPKGGMQADHERPVFEACARTGNGHPKATAFGLTLPTNANREAAGGGPAWR